MLGDYPFQLELELENIAEDKDIDRAALLNLVPLNKVKQLKTGRTDGCAFKNLPTVCSSQKKKTQEKEQLSKLINAAIPLGKVPELFIFMALLQDQ